MFGHWMMWISCVVVTALPFLLILAKVFGGVLNQETDGQQLKVDFSGVSRYLFLSFFGLANAILFFPNENFKGELLFYSFFILNIVLVILSVFFWLIFSIRKLQKQVLDLQQSLVDWKEVGLERKEVPSDRMSG